MRVVLLIGSDLALTLWVTVHTLRAVQRGVKQISARRPDWGKTIVAKPGRPSRFPT